MPTYEYECPQGHLTEDFVSMAERSAPRECGFEIVDGLLCAEAAELAVSMPLCHIWEERAASNILTRSASKQKFTGRLKDGQQYETYGGPHPDADTVNSDGD